MEKERNEVYRTQYQNLWSIAKNHIQAQIYRFKLTCY